MGFKSSVIGVKKEVKDNLPSIIFNNVRCSSIQKTRRNRQCFYCGERTIKKGDNYVNHQMRYDNKIVTISFHEGCYK